MKRSIIKRLLPLAVLFASAACGEWTETESLDIDYPTLEEQNPELYARYLRSLRDYKARDHKITFVTVDNVPYAPSQQNEHLTTLPDSVDFISLADPARVHPTLAAEMTQVREKGTRTVYPVDYDRIESDWERLLEEEEANRPETPAGTAEDAGSGDEGGEPDPDPAEVQEQRFLDYCREQAAQQLAYCDRYGFDGVVLCMTGRNPDGMAAEERSKYTARQEAFLRTANAWSEEHADKLLFFRGKPQYLTDKSLLGRCTCIILPALEAVSPSELALEVVRASVAGVPADRLLVEVSTVDPTDATDDTGYFLATDADGRSRLRAIKGAAQWVVEPAAYPKAGIAVTRAQNDYFDVTLVYRNIREAIGIMNPAPKN